MAGDERTPLRVAVLAQSGPRREAVGRQLERQGFQLAAVAAADAEAIAQVLALPEIDLLLVDLDDESLADPGALLPLLEHSRVPVLFNDAGAAGQADLGPRLTRKFRLLSGTRPPRLSLSGAPAAPAGEPRAAAPRDGDPAGRGADADRVGTDAQDRAPAEDAAPAPMDPVPGGRTLERRAPASGGSGPAVEAPAREARADAPAAAGGDRARRVWVLGASLGGPQAVRAFLHRLPGDLPVAFILAQHIGEGFDRLLASQLDRETALRVGCARAGARLRHGEVLLAPLDQSLRLDRSGAVRLEPRVERGIYSPSIDDVMGEVARCYGALAGAIVFSGMGDDGIEGARAIAAEGGTVWAQDAASAVISSMPDHARRAGVVSLSGPPESLAEQLVRTLAAPGASAAL